MKHYLYTIPHVITLCGLAFAALALMAVLEGDWDVAARYSLLVLAVDRIDGTLARKLNVKERFPNTSGEVLDIITDLVGLTFVPMVLFWKTGLFLDGTGAFLVCASAAAASWKYARKEGFLERGYSVGAPPVFFSVFLFYFLEWPPVVATVYTAVLIVLVISPVRYPITSLVTTHWQPGYRSATNYLTTILFVPVFWLLKDAPDPVYIVLLIAIGVQLFIDPLLLGLGVIKPVFNRRY